MSDPTGAELDEPTTEELDTASAEEEPAAEELDEPSTEKEPAEVATSPATEERRVDHHAVGIGIVDVEGSASDRAHASGTEPDAQTHTGR